MAGLSSGEAYECLKKWGGDYHTNSITLNMNGLSSKVGVRNSIQRAEIPK